MNNAFIGVIANFANQSKKLISCVCYNYVILQLAIVVDAI